MTLVEYRKNANNNIQKWLIIKGRGHILGSYKRGENKKKQLSYYSGREKRDRL